MSGVFSVVFLHILFKYDGTALELHSCRGASYEPLLFSEDIKSMNLWVKPTIR